MKTDFILTTLVKLRFLGLEFDLSKVYLSYLISHRVHTYRPDYPELGKKWMTYQSNKLVIQIALTIKAFLKENQYTYIHIYYTYLS